VIKVIWAAHRKPGMSDDAFYHHWGQVHGPLGSRCTTMRRYVQHHTLAEARDGRTPVPTHDGASIAWFDDVDGMLASYTSPEWDALRRDSPNLFDPGRPMDVVIASEHVVLDGKTTPSMVKLITLVRPHADISPAQFRRHWHDEHLRRCSETPALRRSVQNHRISDIDDPHQLSRRMTHHSWSEDWFDDLDALRSAVASPAWQMPHVGSTPLFDAWMPTVVARETPIVS
jgi:uncharacterized protein (TIGR02118 family)